MAKGPQTFIREPVVVPLFLLVRKPQSSQVIRLLSRRHTNMSAPVSHVLVCGAASVGDPNTGACMHHGLKGRDQPACRVLNFDATVIPAFVNVGLTVLYDD